MASPFHVIFRQNDNVVELLALTDELTGSLITGATVTLQLVDDADVSIGSPVTLADVSGSPGDYRGIVESTLDLSSYGEIFGEVTVSDGSGGDAFWKLRVKVEDRD